MRSVRAKTSSEAADSDDGPSTASSPLLLSPDDILMVITDHLSRADIGALVRTSRRCHQALNHQLYVIDWFRNDEFRGSALFWACFVSKPETARKALAAGADPHAQAAGQDTWSLVNKYRYGTETWLPTSRRRKMTLSAVQLVTIAGDVEMARSLVESGKADFSRLPEPLKHRPMRWCPAFTDSPIFAAIKSDHGELVHYLLQTYGYAATRQCGNNVLACAVHYKKQAAIRAILRNGDFTDPLGPTGFNGLLKAVHYKKPGLVRLILAKSRSDPNILSPFKIDDGDDGVIQLVTPLFIAVRWNQLEMVEALLRNHRTNPEFAGPNLHSTVFYAVQWGSWDSFRELVKRVTYDADFLFEEACHQDRVQVATWLIEKTPFDETRLQRWYDVLESSSQRFWYKSDGRHVKLQLDAKRDKLSKGRQE